MANRGRPTSLSAMNVSAPRSGGSTSILPTSKTPTAATTLTWRQHTPRTRAPRRRETMPPAWPAGRGQPPPQSISSVPSSTAIPPTPAGVRMACTQAAVCQQCLDGLAPPCNVCGMPTRHKACAKCRLAHYCSKECQNRDWPYHRRECSMRGAGFWSSAAWWWWSCNNGGASADPTRMLVRCHSWHLRTMVTLYMQATKGFRTTRRVAIASNLITLDLMLHAWPRSPCPREWSSRTSREGGTRARRPCRLPTPRTTT